MNMPAPARTSLSLPTRLLVAALGCLVLLYAVACLVLWAKQADYRYFPVRTRLAQIPVEVLHRPDARVLVSVQPFAGGDAIVYFGGNAEDVSRTVPELARWFPRSAIYAMHYRGYGGSEGTAEETALVGDALALFDRVHRGHPSVTAIGRSLGTGIAVQLAAARPLARLVLVTPYDSIVAVGAEQFPAFPVAWLARDRYDSAAVAGAIRTPTTLVIAQQDRVIPPAHAQRLLRSFAPGVAHAVVLDGVGHNDVSRAPGYAQALGAATPAAPW